MSDAAAAQFTGDIPRFYDEHLGPVIFVDYAADLARRAATIAGSNVLEIAAGTGISTAALRAALPAGAHITATDLNPAMLDIASKKFSGGDGVEFRQADAMALPFEDARFDLATIQFGVMFFPDRPAAYAQIKRVLKPGGALLFNVWGDMAANPFAEIAHATVAHHFPDNPPKFYQTPFGYADAAQVRADLVRGGFGDVEREIVRFHKPVGDWRHFARGLVFGNPIISDIEAAGEVSPEDMVTAIADALQTRIGAAPAALPLEASVYLARA
ncbi:MAG: class I SAM-dependent methyltransferase [Hyphomonadaceae bacterium]